MAKAKSSQRKASAPKRAGAVKPRATAAKARARRGSAQRSARSAASKRASVQKHATAFAAPRELRQQLAELLDGDHAHADFHKAAANWPAHLVGQRPAGAPYTPWQILEHMRIAQWDILNFSLNPQHTSPSWPTGYWPPSESPAPGEWEKSVAAFEHDLEALRRLALDPKQDLFRPIPHGAGQTLLREIMLAADHNSNHLGQLILLRRLQSAWPS